MISNKTAATMFLVAFVVPVIFASNTPKPGLLDKFISRVKKLVPRLGTREIMTPALTTDNTVGSLKIQKKNHEFPDDTQRTSQPSKSTLKTRQGPAHKPEEVLVDTSNTVNDVEIQRENSGETGISQELSVAQVNNPLKAPIEQGKYWKIFELGEKMSNGEFMRQLCPIVETFDHYKRVVKYLKKYDLVASFYVNGNIEVVKGAIIESNIYDGYNHYVKDGDLETALPLALEGDRHDRVIELLDVRKEITAEGDGQRELDGIETSFGGFVYDFLENLAPWKDGMALKRFFVFRGEELRSKHHNILDTICQRLVYHLSDKLHLPNAKRLLTDLIGQPLLLTPVTFVRGFLVFGFDEYRSAFIKYGWRETIQECLKSECEYGGKQLWRVMQIKQPNQYPGAFPATEEARAAACAHLPTKQEKENEWIRENAPGFLETVELALVDIFPTVLIPIVFEYVRPTLIDVPSTKP